MEDNKAPDVPMPCTAGCGFYGNKIYNNMCSKCFREQAEQKKKAFENAAPAEEQSQKVESTSTKEPESSDKTEAPATATEPVVEKKDKLPVDAPSSKPVQKNIGRCFQCRAKIPLAKQVSNKCRCEYVFCDTHRYPDKHECDFDHASMDKDILAKKNPKLNERPRGGRSFQRLDSL